MVKKIKGLERKNCASSFTLIGRAKVTDGSIKLNCKAKESDWLYNTLKLGIDCGEKHGTVFCEMMGGYGTERENKIFAHGIKEDGTDNFEEKIEIDWEDRFDEDIFETIGRMCFIRVGLEKDNKGKTFYKDFLSQYDAIDYINEHLKDGMIVNVRGNIKYQPYNGKIYVKKEITSIVLSKVEDEKDFTASFRQTILITRDSVGVDDKSKGVFLVNARVLEYVKNMNGYEITNGFVPLPKTFEYAVNFEKPELVERIKQKIFNVRRDVTQITFDGEFIESGSVVKTTIDDLDDDIKELIEMGAYTLEEALEDASDKGSTERRMVFVKPAMTKADKDKGIKASIRKVEKAYTEEEINMPCLVSQDDNDLPFSDDETDSDTDNETIDDDDLDFLNDIE